MSGDDNGSRITQDDLRILSHRATVAFAVRCARRVQFLTWILPEEQIQRLEQALDTVERWMAQDSRADRGVRILESVWAAASSITDWAYEYPRLAGWADGNQMGIAWAAARASAAVARVADAAASADVAVDAAFWAAKGAAQAIRSAAQSSGSLNDADAWVIRIADGHIHAAAWADYQRLRRWDQNSPGMLDKPFDCTESGPLGPLWP